MSLCANQVQMLTSPLKYFRTQKILSFLFLLFLVSCQDAQPVNRRDMLPGYIGKAGEVMVIMDDIYWNGTAGDVVREALSKPIPSMPQFERMFDYQHFNHANFDKFIHPHRNILFVDIRDNINYKTPKVQVIQEQYARDQIVINCSAMTADDFILEFKKVSSVVKDRINEAEYKRLINYFEVFGNKEASAQIRLERQIELLFPDLSKIMENHDEFVWAHKVTARPKDQQMHDVQQGIVIYEYPYTDDSTFTKSFLLNKRDSVFKKWMPGPDFGSYMTTERVHDDPLMIETSIEGKYAVEMRGLWKMENAFMGGPFVSLTTFDERRGKIVTIEGFVFAPKFDKREYLREVEACVKSFHYSNPEQTSK